MHPQNTPAVSITRNQQRPSRGILRHLTALVSGAAAVPSAALFVTACSSGPTPVLHEPTYETAEAEVLAEEAETPDTKEATTREWDLLSDACKRRIEESERMAANFRAFHSEPLDHSACYSSCAKGFSPSGDARKDVERLGDLCGAPCCMVNWNQIESAPAPEMHGTAMTGTFFDGLCYRIFAVGDRGVEALNSIFEQNSKLTEDKSTDRVGILPREAAYCPNPGGFNFGFFSTKGAGVVQFQIWVGPGKGH